MNELAIVGLMLCGGIVLAGLTAFGHSFYKCHTLVGVNHEFTTKINKTHEFDDDQSDSEEVAVCVKCGDVVEFNWGGKKEVESGSN